MSKVINLDLGKGNLINGFPNITVTLANSGRNYFLKTLSSLPPNLELNRLFQRWLLLYETYSNFFRATRMEIAEAAVERYSQKDFKDLVEQLRKVFNDWLDSPEFIKKIVLPISNKLTVQDEIQIIISTDDLVMRQFPWHLWQFFTDYPKAEMSLGSLEFQVSNQAITPIGKVRVLAILGNSKEIDLLKDKQQLERLPGVELQFLPPSQKENCNVSRKIINKYLWDKKGWDILFFAGHSQTEDDRGILAINEYEELAIDDLKFALEKAIANGLKLAIFNSCNGLGLAKQLEELHIPQIIVMRYPIPDTIAHQFLKHFLIAFSSHKSLYVSVREAREKLQGLEDRYPCASWLPVIIQNPSTIPPTWKTLIGHRVSLRQILQPLLLTSLVGTGLILGIRSLGLLQTIELKAYDYLVRLQPIENPDRRLLLITITENDVYNQPIGERNGTSLSNKMLEQIINKLARSEAVAIGLDLYRETSVGKDYPALAKWMGESDRFFAVCPYGSSDVVSPPDVSPQRQGFNNVLLDSDEILRRSLLAVESPAPCQSHYAFGWQLAKSYITQTHPEYTFEPNNQEGYMQLGKTVFKTLDLPTGGYQKFDPLGHQILVNYRNTPQIAETVTLKDFLEQYPLEKIGRRIVMIGTIAPSFNDHRWYTPLGKMTGVEVQAHLTSQILSTVLDERPSIWSWNVVLEGLWILGWSCISGLTSWKLQSVKHLFLGYSVAVIILGVSCWGVFVFFGGWIPLIPSVLVLVITGGTFLYYKQKQLI